jgi:hypothetical protein
MVLLVIINYLNVVSIRAAPAKAYSPLMVNPNAVLPGTAAQQTFQMIPRRYTQLIQAAHRMEKQQFAPCRALDILETRHWQTAKETLCVPAGEGPYHDQSILLESIFQTNSHHKTALS